MHSTISRAVVITVLCGIFLLGGCQSFNIEAFGVPIHTPGRQDAIVLAANDDGIKLSTEEKWGVVLLLALAIGGTVVLLSS